MVFSCLDVFVCIYTAKALCVENRCWVMDGYENKDCLVLWIRHDVAFGCLNVIKLLTSNENKVRMLR